MCLFFFPRSAWCVFFNTVKSRERERDSGSPTSEGNPRERRRVPGMGRGDDNARALVSRLTPCPRHRHGGVLTYNIPRENTEISFVPRLLKDVHVCVYEHIRATTYLYKGTRALSIFRVYLKYHLALSLFLA